MLFHVFLKLNQMEANGCSRAFIVKGRKRREICYREILKNERIGWISCG